MTPLFGEVFGIPSFALGYQGLYGPGQSLKNPFTSILAIFSNLARVGADSNVFGDGEESSDFLYVHIDDVVCATVAFFNIFSTVSIRTRSMSVRMSAPA